MRTLLILFVLMVSAAPVVPVAAPADVSAVVSAVRLMDDGRLSVEATAGYSEGVMPGDRLTVSRQGLAVGWLKADRVLEHSCRGVFESGCTGCKPELGDTVSKKKPAPPAALPSIKAPAGGELKKPNLTEKESSTAEKAFLDFIEGKSSIHNRERTASPSRGNCPAMEAGWPPGPATQRSPDPDSDIETELFPSPGDWLKISGWNNLPPFCAPVSDDGKIETELVEPVDTSGKNLAALEATISTAHPDKTDGLDLTLLPRDSIRSVATVRILGAAPGAGAFEFREKPRLADALSRAGVSDDFRGSVLAIGWSAAGKRQIREISVGLVPEGEEDTGAGTVLDHGEIVFVPESPGEADDFLRLVLPYLKENSLPAEGTN